SVSSGRSHVAVRGASGHGQQAEGQQIDATVDLAVASLNDWVPDTFGSLAGRFRVRGVWPKLNIDGAADGKGLGMRAAGVPADEATRIRQVHVAATVDSPLDPDGKVEITANGIKAAGYELATARITGSGNQASHRATLDAKGDKLVASLAVAGG